MPCELRRTHSPRAYLLPHLTMHAQDFGLSKLQTTVQFTRHADAGTVSAYLAGVQTLCSFPVHMVSHDLYCIPSFIPSVIPLVPPLHLVRWPSGRLHGP